MILNTNPMRIFVKPGFTDMRKQINGLSSLVQGIWLCDAMDGSFFIFAGKCRRRLKILYWDRNGFCLWQKRLEKDHFPWPRDGDEVRELSREQLGMLLDGIDFWKAHQELRFSSVG